MTKRAKLLWATSNAGLTEVTRPYAWQDGKLVYLRGVFGDCPIYSDARMFGMVRVKYSGALCELSAPQVARLRKMLARQFRVPIAQVRTYAHNRDICVFHSAAPKVAPTLRPSTYDGEQYARRIFKLSPLGGRR